MKPPAVPGEIIITDTDLVTLDADAVLWRIHPTTGDHVRPWNALRHFGPSTGRFDPHPSPAGEYAEYAVTYAALDPYTPFAEVYQRGRAINRTAGAAYLTAWRTTRKLRLLDLTGTWPIANGASHTLSTGRHDYCRAWAHAIHDHHARVDGLWHASAMAGNATVTLFTPAADSFPPTPVFSRAVTDPAVRPLIDAAARRYNYRVVG